MSRETDSTSSGPQGHGGAAYPSGTPPYGARPFPSLHPPEPSRADDAASGAAPDRATYQGDEPRTETTVTTRVSINIPGSRPIPPVVVRTPVDGDGGASAGGASAGKDELAGGDEPAGDLPSGWTVGAADPLPTVSAPAQAFASPTISVPAPAEALEQREKKDKGKGANDWFSPRKPVAPTTAPASPFDMAPSDFAQAAAAPAPAQPSAADSTQPMNLSDLSGLSPKAPPAAARFPDGTGGPGGTGEYAFGGPDGPGHTGEFPSPSPSAVRGGSGNPGKPGNPDGGPPFPSGPAAGPFGSPVPAVPRPFPGAGSPSTGGGPGSAPFPGYQPAAGLEALGGSTTGPVTGGVRIPPAPGAHGLPGPAAQGGAAGDTLIGGIPKITDPMVTPQNATHPVPSGGEAQRFEEQDEEPAAKGRSKLILAAIGLLAAVGIAYGAGLLMDHADVPTGTTVLGVDIGGTSKEQAAQALESALGKRRSDVIALKVGSKDHQLTPSIAGLGIDIDTTVADVAHRDYNPVVVIGSLFGGTRAVEPAWIVDREKLEAQLDNFSSRASSSGSDGMVKFVDGKAVAVPGKPHESLDVSGSASKIIDAYQQHVATGADDTVTLAAKTVQPKVTQAQLDAAVNGFGKTAMSGLITVKAGSAVIQFGPALSLPKILTMVPDANGVLTPKFDLAVLKQLYGSTFDGVLLERGNGSKTPVTPQDVASAMMPALRTTDQSAKTVTLLNVAQ